jgi:hypothetical protein
MFRSVRRAGMLALALAFATACSPERAAAPTSVQAPVAAASGDLLGTVTSTLGLTSKNGLQRTTALAAPITVQQTIGIYGGTLSIPAAGVSVYVPAGAVSRPTLITMTARAGTLVAYDFEPHGIVFNKPLVFTQRLSGTKVSILQAPLLKLGYYSDPSLLGQTTALVSDLIGGLINVLTWTFTAPIKHFSGYIVLCG